MPLRCAKCLDPIKSIDQLFQCFVTECEEQEVITPAYNTSINHCFQSLRSWERYVRNNAVFSIKHPKISSTEPDTYSYYCARCGITFKDAVWYLGDTQIKYGQQIEANLHYRSFSVPNTANYQLEHTPKNKTLVRVRSPSPVLSSERKALLGQGRQYNSYGAGNNHVSLALPQSGTVTPPIEEDVSSEFFELNSIAYKSEEAIRAQIRPNKVYYDAKLTNAKYPEFFMALYVLSQSFRVFVDAAIKANKSFTKHLYSECNWRYSPNAVCKKWLEEAKTKLDALNQCIRTEHLDPYSDNSYFLLRTPTLTTSAVEALLVEADNAMVLRPSSLKWFVLSCLAFLGLLSYLILRFGLHDKIAPEPHHETTLAPNHTTTTTATSPPIDNPCHFTDECALYVYRQIWTKLTILQRNGYTTVGSVYRHCEDGALFNYARTICFATDPEFGGLLENNDRIQGLIDYFKNLLEF